MAKTNLKRELEKLTLLHEFDLALSTLEVNECIQNLVTRLRGLFQADFAALLVHKQGMLDCIAADGLPLPNNSITFDASTGLCGWVFRHAQSINVGNVQQDARYVSSFDSIRSEMTAPLMVQGECIGVVDLESSQPAAFSDDDLKLLEMAAFSAANALHNAQVHTQANYWRTYYQAVVNQTGDIIYTVDRDLRLTSVNAAWDVFAQENDGLAWHSTASTGKLLLSGFEGVQKDKWQKVCSELVSGERETYSEDIPCHAPEIERWLMLRAAPLKDDTGQVAGIIFSTHDITEHVFSERRLRALNTQLETLLRISQVLNQSLPNKNTSQVIVETLAEVMQVDCVTIVQFDEYTQAFKVAAAQGASERHVRDYRSPWEQMGRIIEQYGNSATIYQLTDTLNSVNVPIYQEDHLHGLLFALIEHKGKTFGSVNIFTSDPQRRFTTEEKELVRALTPQLGLAMENAWMYDQLHSLATTDGLTGLINRRQLDDMLAAEAERSLRYHRGFSILMIDLDHFKCYNDTFGHPRGDELLKQIAKLFQTTLRASDFAARYGGDEFLIILPETEIAGAVILAGRLQTAMQINITSRIESGDCPMLTLSIGAASFPAHAETPADLLRCADQALYRAKQSGRNKVEVCQ